MGRNPWFGVMVEGVDATEVKDCAEQIATSVEKVASTLTYAPLEEIDVDDYRKLEDELRPELMQLH